MTEWIPVEKKLPEVNELNYCKDCIRAKKPQAQGEVEMWLCGKHRRCVTLHTLVPTSCKDYQRKVER